MRHTFPREFYVPTDATEVADTESDAVAYLYNTKSGKPAALMFFGKQAKPVFHHSYSKEANRDKAVSEAFAGRKATVDYKAKIAKERKTFVHDYKVGEILHTCWGYEQTNVEFFQIVEVSGKMLTLREVCQERVATGMLQGRCMPVKDKFVPPRYAGDERGQPIRRLAQQGRVKIDDVRTAWRTTDGSAYSYSEYH